jgi:hypothetical protein
MHLIERKMQHVEVMCEFTMTSTSTEDASKEYNELESSLGVAKVTSE